MNRRHFSLLGLSSIAAVSTHRSAKGAQPSYFYELRSYELRNDIEPAHVHTFFEEHFMPMIKARAAGPVGCFEVMTGQLSPALQLLIPHASLAHLLVNTDQVGSAGGFVDNWRLYELATPLPYVRYQASLLKAFSGHPQIELPKQDGQTHIFELRTYESRDAFASAAKIDMFNQEEIKIFRDCGLQPVFFGEGVFGTRLPHLTYMLALDDMRARDEGWRRFGGNEDWNRIKVQPKWVNTVSNIHASFLRPTRYSEIQ